MSRLNHLRDIVDQRLHRITMTEQQKVDVHRKIAEGAPRKNLFRSPCVRRYTALALSMASILLVVLVLPSLVQRNLKSTGTNGGVNGGANIQDATGNADTNTGIDALLSSDSAFDVMAASYTPSGVATDTGFYIKVPAEEGGSADIQTLQSRISLEPAVAYTLELEEENLYLLTPMEVFAQGEVVTVSIDAGDGTPFSWAFQTEAALSVLSTIPGNNGENVPVNTGIEIQFSRMLSADAGERVTISPEVSGTFTIKNKALVFIPQGDLQSNTVYTVTILPGLAADSGEILEDAHSFSFRTSNTKAGMTSYFYINGAFTSNFVPGDTIALEILASDEYAEQNLDVSIYDLGDSGTYLSLAEEKKAGTHPYLGTNQDVVLDPSPYPLTDKFQAKLMDYEYTSWATAQLLILPDLPEGWYLVNIEGKRSDGETQLVQQLVQISTLSVYFQSINNEGLVWLNSTVTGESVDDAQVQFTFEGNTVKAETNADGSAMIRFPNTDEDYSALVITKDSQTYADLIPVDTAKRDATYRYYTSIFLDRPVYLPTDTLQYWGKILPRNNATLPKTAQLAMTQWYGSDEYIHLGEVSISGNGTFSGSFSFESRRSGSYQLHLLVDGVSVYSTSYTIMEYTKPVYTLSPTLDKTYYRKNDTMQLDIEGTFYDGTPASGIQVSVHHNASTILALDAQGHSALFIKPYTYGMDWMPSHQGVSLATYGAENAYSYSYASAYYFPTDYMLTIEDADEDSLSAVIASNAIDFAAFEAHMDDYYSHIDEMKGAPADVSGTITLRRHYYERFSTGTRYDPIRKITYETFDTNYLEEIIYTQPFQTVDGVFVTLPYTAQADDTIDYAYYVLEVNYTAPDGGSFTSTHYFYGNYYWDDYNNDYYVTSTQEDYRQLGDAIELYLTGGAEITGGQTLYAVSTYNFLSHAVVDKSLYSGVFTQEMIPNAIVRAAYFDGRHVYQCSPYYLYFDNSTRALTLEIETETDKYKPGDTVKGTLRITDGDGKPVSADYALAVVDEALFAVAEQYVDPLNDLYAFSYYPTAYVYTSYDALSSLMNAEGGGGSGNGDIRSEFLDTADFITGTTNASGSATFSFTLPDNLTSWRITAVSISDDAWAGTVQHNVRVSIPFFINLVLNDRYHKDDDVAFSARVYGANTGEPVKYTVEIGGEETTYEGSFGAFQFINLGKLEPGTYEITIYAVAGLQKDAIQRSITVEESLHEVMAISHGSLSDGVDISAVKFPVTLTFYDREMQLYMSALWRLQSYSSARLDYALANTLAKNRLAELQGAAGTENLDNLLPLYQDYDGGLRLLPYGDLDVHTTAMTLLSASNLVDSDAAAGYLYAVLGDTKAAESDVALAYMGLAAMREPVLNDIRALLADTNLFSDTDRLYLACGLALLGDQKGAIDYYVNQIKPSLTTTDTLTYVNLGSMEASYAATDSAALLAILVNAPEQEAMIRYLVTNISRETYPGFTLMTYLTRNPAPKSSASFSCIYNGTVKTWDFSENPVVTLQFNAGELTSADFRLLSGEVGYTANYISGTDAIEDNSQGLIAVRSKANWGLATGELTTLTFTVDLAAARPTDNYVLDLILPTGVRYVSHDTPMPYGRYYLLNREGNRMTFLIPQRKSLTAETIEITVTVCSVLPGEFAFEAPILSGVRSGLTAVGNYQRVIVE